MDLFDRLRRLRIRIRLFSLTLLAIILAFVVMLFCGLSEEAIGILASLTLSLVLGFVLLVALTVTRYKKLCKDNLMKELLEDSYASVSYREKDGFSEEEIAASGMIMMGNVFESANLVKGERGDISFEMADVTVSRKTQSGKGYHTVTFFDGCWMTFHLSKSFGATIHIKEKGFSGNQSITPGRKMLSPVNLEHREFNRFFRVHTSDEERARYILTQPFMEAVLAINCSLQGDLMLALSDDTIHFAIHGIKRDLDEILPDEVDRRTLKREMLLDVSMITDFVDHLAEDETLFVSENSPAQEVL